MKTSLRYMQLLKANTVIENNIKLAIFKNLRLSFKKGVNVCRYVLNDTFYVAMEKLGLSAEYIKPIPFYTHCGGIGHKSGIAAGRYCVKFSKYLLIILKNILKNRNVKPEKVKICEIYVTKGKTVWGLNRRARGHADRIKKKSCNIYLKYKIL